MLGSAFMIFLLVFGAASALRLRKMVFRDSLLYADAAAWMDANCAKDETVFTGDWDDPSPLFYGAPKQRYLVFLEPYFMKAHSPEKFDLWMRIILGKVRTPSGIIREEFGADIVFVGPDNPFLRKSLEQDPASRLVFTGPDGERIYRIGVLE